MDRTQQDYRDATHGLLPQGKIWPKSRGDSIIGGVLDVLSSRLLAANANTDALTNELFPDNSGRFLVDWERVMDLPRPGISGQTSQERVGTVLAWLNIDPYSNLQFFEDIATLMGFSITANDKNTKPALNLEELEITTTLVGPEVFARAGDAVAGDRIIENASNDALEALILFFAQAGTKVIFNYV